MSCPCCIEVFNKRGCRQVKCQKCEYSACHACIKKYLLGSLKVAHCMNCNADWDRLFIVDNLTRTFVYGDYKKHREQLLLETEKARLPDDMENAIRVRKLDVLKEKRKEIKEQILLLRNNVHQVEHEIYLCGRIMRGETVQNEKSAKPAPKREFIQKCPGDTCNGMLSTQWKCKICDLTVCAKCHEIKSNPACGGGAPHVCKQSNIDSVIFMKKDTKPCPSCGVKHKKISGCDQMWCPNCHKAYSWKTGEIVTHGIIHNPHFIQYQKKLAKQGKTTMPRAAGDLICGGLPYYFDFRERVIRPLQPARVPYARTRVRQLTYAGTTPKKKHADNLWANVTDLYRNTAHLQTIVDNFRNEVNRLDNNSDLRIKFILNKINEKNFSKTISRRALHKEKATSILHIYELLNNILTENIRHLYNNPSRENCKSAIKNCHAIRVYSNEELKKISVLYGHTVKILNEDFYSCSVKYNNKTLRKEHETKSRCKLHIKKGERCPDCKETDYNKAFLDGLHYEAALKI